MPNQKKTTRPGSFSKYSTRQFIKVGEQLINMNSVTFVEVDDSIRCKTPEKFTIIRFEFIGGSTISILLETAQANRVMKIINSISK
jgi:hypothetical protein